MTPQSFVMLPALIAGLTAVLVLGAGLLLGSRTLRHYDPALLLYTFGTMFSAFALVYRYTVWLMRPPTRLYWRRAWSLLCQRRGAGRRLLLLAGALGGNFVVQRFIQRRGWGRWVAHFCMSWGTILAAAVTFPLVFGWIHFESQTDAPQVYHVLVFGLHAGSLHVQSLGRYIMFNLLNLSAVLVVIGVGCTLHRRLKEAGAVAAQQFGNDLVPLLLLLAVAVTGLMLTFSMHALHGAGYVMLSLIHAVTVIATLLYMPFGKLFHIFQRPLHLGVTLYKHDNATAPQAHCRLCGEAYAGAKHVEDLKGVLRDVGLDWPMGEPMTHYMHVCPACRRRQVGFWHGQVMARAHRQDIAEHPEPAQAHGIAAPPAQADALTPATPHLNNHTPQGGEPWLSLLSHLPS